jgi:hypothetical protein
MRKCDGRERPIKATGAERVVRVGVITGLFVCEHHDRTIDRRKHRRHKEL